MSVEGHTDERGGREYNLALGQKRAEAVAKSLALLGADDNQLEAVSFGKERPAVQGSDEAAWAKNRRAELELPVMRVVLVPAFARPAVRALRWSRRCSRRPRTPASSTTTRRAGRSSTCARRSSRATSSSAPGRPSR